MYIEGESEPQPVKLGAPLKVALAFSALLVISIGVYPQPVINLTQKAALSQGLKTYDYDQKDKAGQPPDSGIDTEDEEPAAPPR